VKRGTYIMSSGVISKVESINHFNQGSLQNCIILLTSLPVRTKVFFLLVSDIQSVVNVKVEIRSSQNFLLVIIIVLTVTLSYIKNNILFFIISVHCIFRLTITVAAWSKT
jgi:hypothetical protein